MKGKDSLKKYLSILTYVIVLAGNDKLKDRKCKFISLQIYKHNI
jgi:hypothetical protein